MRKFVRVRLKCDVAAAVCISMEMVNAKISTHAMEAPDIVLELKAQLDMLHSKLEVIH